MIYDILCDLLHGRYLINRKYEYQPIIANTYEIMHLKWQKHCLRCKIHINKRYKVENNIIPETIVVVVVALTDERRPICP